MKVYLEIEMPENCLECPCCTSSPMDFNRDRWCGALTVIKNEAFTIEEARPNCPLKTYEDSGLSPQDIDRLKAANKSMYEALMCLPGAMGATVTSEVCRVCLKCRDGAECEECIIDKAIREGMGG